MARELEPQSILSAEIAALETLRTPSGHPLRDYPPYRSSVLRHPTHELVRVDPEEVERTSPAFGQTDVNILDIAACVAIVNEAGGRFTELNGAPITLKSTTVLATNGAMHGPVIAALG